MNPDLLQEILIQLAVIISAARAGAWLFGKLGQPQVVGEILAGLILGPSVLGRFEISWLHLEAGHESVHALRVLSELGLVLLMFLIGIEFNFQHLRGIGRAAGSVAVAGIIFPFFMGAVLAYWLYPHVAAEVPRFGFVLFVATALSITAIPILGRIMVELGIQSTRLGVLTITAAAVDDVLGWILLAAVSALVRGGFQWLTILWMLTTVILFVGIVFLLRPLYFAFIRRHWVPGNRPSLVVLSTVLVGVMLSAATTQALGVFAAFGPFVLGAALSSDRRFSEAIIRELHPLVYALLLPIFFTYTGLQTDIGLLDSTWLWGVCILIFAVATGGKFFGCGLAALLGGFSWRESACVAVMMNTRALMGLVAINVGRELGVVPPNVFSMLVLMAIATTVVTTPVLRRLLRSAPVEHAVQDLDRALRV